MIKLLDDESPQIAFEAARCLFKLSDFEHLSLPVAIARGGLAVEASRLEALQMLETLQTIPSMAQAVRSALILAMWDKDERAAWTSAAFFMDCGASMNLGIPRGLIFGRRRSWEDGSWETMERLEKLLQNPATRGDTIDALFSGLYGEEGSHRFDLIGLLVRAGAPLYDRVLARMADACRWGMSAAPLALLAVSGRAKEARDAAEKMGIREVVELVGEC